MGLRQIGAHLQGHPDMTRTPGVEVSTGSLGQGLSMSLGICLALRLDGLDDAHVFALMSDGDCQEGQSWEARDGRRALRRPNLTAIVDYNHLQTDGTTEEVMDIGDVRAKFEAFGWDAVEIDGHDMNAVVEALECSRTLRRPGGDRLPDEEGQRRLADGGPLRLPRQAADARAGRAGAGASSRPRSPSRPRHWRTLTASDPIERSRAQSEPIADAQGLRRRAGGAGRAAPGGRRARRRPRRLDSVDRVRQAVPRALLQRRRRGGEHDVDGLRPRRHRQGPLRLDLRDLRHLRAPTTRSGSGSPTTSSRSGSAPRTAASRWARTAPRTR